MTESQRLRALTGQPAQVTALTLAAFVLMAVGIGDGSLWLDEAESWVWSLLPLSELSAVTGWSNHAPTYYAVLHGWRLLGGESEAWLRLLSALFMALTVPLVYLLTRTVSDHKTGIFAALVFASSPFVYEFGQEARPYAMLTFFAGAGMLCMAVKIRECVNGLRPVIISRGWSEGRPGSDLLWLAFMAATLVTISTHHTALLFPFIVGVAYAVVSWSSPHRRVHWLNMAVAAVVVGSIYAALFLPAFLTSLGRFEQDPVGLRNVYWGLVQVYGNSRISLTTPILGVATLFALWGWYRDRQWRWPVFFLTAWLGLLALELLTGAVHGSVFKYRTLAWTLVPFSAIVGIGLLRIGPKPHLWLATLLLLNGAGIFFIHVSTQKPWEEVAATIAGEYRDGDAVVICPGYYRKVFVRHWTGSTEDLWGSSQGDTLGESGYKVRPLASPDSGIALYAHKRSDLGYRPLDLLERYDRVWLVPAGGPGCSLDPDALARVEELSFGNLRLRVRPWPSRLLGPSSKLPVMLYQAEARPE